APELEEVFKLARMLRLFQASDTLARALTNAWNGRDSYTEAVNAIRTVLIDEMITASRQDAAPVSLMTMHRSKGKEFDAVILFEGQHIGKLLDAKSDARTNSADRRLLRVALTRARHRVVLIRPNDAI